MADTFVADERTLARQATWRAGRMWRSADDVGNFAARFSAERATNAARFHSCNHRSLVAQHAGLRSYVAQVTNLSYRALLAVRNNFIY